jgi:hypothetical protein
MPNRRADGSRHRNSPRRNFLIPFSCAVAGLSLMSGWCCCKMVHPRPKNKKFKSFFCKYIAGVLPTFRWGRGFYVHAVWMLEVEAPPRQIRLDSVEKGWKLMTRSLQSTTAVKFYPAFVRLASSSPGLLFARLKHGEQSGTPATHKSRPRSTAQRPGPHMPASPRQLLLFYGEPVFIPEHQRSVKRQSKNRRRFLCGWFPSCRGRSLERADELQGKKTVDCPRYGLRSKRLAISTVLTVCVVTL